MTTSRKKRFSPAERFGIWHCAAVLLSQAPKKCTGLDLSLLYILVSGIYSKIARENHFLAPGVCFPQPCSSAGRVKITFNELPTNRFVFTTNKSMKCVVNWIPLRIGVRLRNIQPHFKMRNRSFRLLWGFFQVLFF